MATYAPTHRREPDGRFGHGPRASSARSAAGRPGPVLPRRHLAEHRRPRRDLGVGADARAGAEHAAGADAGAGADLDRAEVEHVAVDPVAGEVDLGLDRGARAEA